MKSNDFKLRSRRLFISVQNIFSIKLSYPCFFSDFLACLVFLYYFCESNYFFHVSLCFQNNKLNVAFTATASNMECICFTYTYMQITLHSGDFTAWRQNITFDFSDMLPFLGTLFILTYNQHFFKLCFKL